MLKGCATIMKSIFTLGKVVLVLFLECGERRIYKVGGYIFTGKRRTVGGYLA